MSPKLILYNFDLSPPVRAVKIVAKLLGLELELRDLNLFEREHLKEDFVKINPEHTVPTLVDGDFVIWDSHAICTYLIDKYGNDDQLYPKDLQLRAKCDQRLFFEATNLFPHLRILGYSVLLHGAKEITTDMTLLIYAAYDVLENFLKTDPFLVGHKVTVADINMALTLSFVQAYAPLSADKHSNILGWLDRLDRDVPLFPFCAKFIKSSDTYRYRSIHSKLNDTYFSAV